MLAAEPINAPWQTADIAEDVTFNYVVYPSTYGFTNRFFVNEKDAEKYIKETDAGWIWFC